eukprot:CAMPEP_0181357134 /NCGR_PEP_ID=MMETSP1106-20121128/4791_1 /TAXON_ID=81844 /ORGANISM="Mantoniella antarctica, Strain SL-175" /LENGTH=77 /DNA_ID=CAMNT_0023469961 /DNA_START=713 /DNA_END=946 /DNA_ORIENTATION=+
MPPATTTHTPSTAHVHPRWRQRVAALANSIDRRHLSPRLGHSTGAKDGTAKQPSLNTHPMPSTRTTLVTDWPRLTMD